jgi:ABC-type transport system involved in Fe-S cluster assembly fused permease/ATPase subunit
VCVGLPPLQPFFTLLARAWPYVWTRNSLFRKFTFLLSLFFLIAGSLGDLVVPVTLKYAVDQMTGADPQFPVWPIILYGLSTFLATFCDQARDIFYAYVSANTERLVALETFQHLQSLSLSYHLKRETGAVLRSVSRGASSFSGLMRIVLFQILPVFIQVGVVCTYLFLRYEWYFAVVTGGVIIVYFTFTFTTTDWRDKYRRLMNAKDNEFNQKATDALLNFETVKYFNSELHEERRYDKALREYSNANMRSQQTLAVLNNGQALIITAGTVGAMILAARLVVDHKLTIGDFIMLYQFILTLYQPLGYLGTYYRMIKQSMVDVESMLAIWDEKADIKDVRRARTRAARCQRAAVSVRCIDA